MANEIVPSGLTDLITSQAMAAEFLMLLADRDGSILTHPALLHATAPSLTSTVVRVPHIGLMGYDLLTATTPGSEIANTALSDDSTDVTIALRAKRYFVDDLARVIANGKIDPVLFAQDAAISVAMTLISLIANVTDDFTAYAGTSGVDCTWDDVLVAKATLGIAKVGGPLLGIVHPRQWADLEKDALSLGVLPAQTMGGVINVGLGSAYKGQWMGIDFYVSSSVPTANGGADRAGGIFGRGGICWADAQLAPKAGAVDLGRARFQVFDQANYAAESYITSYASGVAQGIDAAGCSLITDA